MNTDLLINSIIIDKFNSYLVPFIKSVIIDEYEDKLCGFVVNTKSKANPTIYKELFIKELDEFEYVSIVDNTIKFVVPDMYNFNFKGRLKVIKTILEGVSGMYYEISESVINKTRTKGISISINNDLTDLDFLIVRYNELIRLRMTEIKEEPVIYPFSNTGPQFNIFDKANKIAADEIKRIISNAIEYVRDNNDA